MLRDLKIFKRNLSKKPNSAEDAENIPIKATDSAVIQTSEDSNRAPLNTIPEPSQIPKSVPEQEFGGARSRVDRTPTKVQGKSGNASWSLRTPEKQVGVSARNKFGWAQKNEISVAESRDDGRDETNHLPPSSRSLGNGGVTNVTPRSSRTVGRVVSNHSECSSTQSTPTKSVTKPPNLGFGLVSGGSRPPVNMGQRAGNFAALSKGIPTSSAAPLVVNTVEVPHFELREDPSFWMDHNVQVVIRVRPLNSTERCSSGYNRCLKQESAQTIAWIGQPETRFTFDHVACESVNQEMLFRVAGLPIVENCLSGYNSCMFAYGQTGSGKTYTMLGEIDELELKPSPHRGMTPRIFEFLFARIRAEEESRRDEKLKYYCKCSFLEIYNEQITDLLEPSSSNLLLREDSKNGVYVENLTESEVQTVNDILKLLTEGAANRKVAATNMNRESSRSHSVFTCVIESRWEKDNTINLRFARLNLVDLAGSERQKTSGAEGERLKEAANINKSLSTLGHVIMLLVDLAHGKQRHIPYRDSKLTFLLQESLGGNSKTMIIANVSPSICCASETLSTLKFAQRAKLIQNNAVVNEDASGDVCALQHQIRILKEELSLLKRQNVSRSLSFTSAVEEDTDGDKHDTTPKEIPEMAHRTADDSRRSTSSGTVRMSTKQLKSLETTLAGALRREQMADVAIKQLEAEIEQLNRLVRQREEDTQCTKMMLRFREDKIQRMESLLGGFMPSDTYLLEEHKALSEELQLLRAKVDKNPEVTRFALENIRLLDKLRRFQDFYEEGEREILLEEVSGLRNQLLQFLNGNIEQYNQSNANMSPKNAVLVSRENDFVNFELKKVHEELNNCRKNLNSCLEVNAKLTREINDLHSELNNLKSIRKDVEPIMDSKIEVQEFEIRLFEEIEKEKVRCEQETIMKHAEETMNLQLELDILKIILQEERSSHVAMVDKASGLSSDLEIAKEDCLQIRRQLEDANDKLRDANSVIEALEGQQILSINELEDLRERKNHSFESLSKQEQEIAALKEQLCRQELKDFSSCPSFEPLEHEDFVLQAKLKRMHDSLEKAKKLNMRYQGDQAFQASNEQEKDEVRRQVEAETAEVIVCLQEELTSLQQQVNDCNSKEIETKQSLLLLESQSEDLQKRLYLLTQDKEMLCQLLVMKDKELQISSEEWEKLAFEIEEVMGDGHEALIDASDQVEFMSSSFPKKAWICEQVGRMIRNVSEKELKIEELEKCLENAQNIKIDMDCKLRSLRGAVLAITEVQQDENSEKEKEIGLLTSLLDEKMSIITELEKIIKIREDQVRKAEICAMVAFVIVNRLSETNSDYLNALKNDDAQFIKNLSDLKNDATLQDHAAVIEEAEKQIQDLRIKLEGSEEICAKLKLKLVEADKHICDMERRVEMFEKGILLASREKVDELKLGVSALNSCVNEYAEKVGESKIVQIPGRNPPICTDGDSQELAAIGASYGIQLKEKNVVSSNADNMVESALSICKDTDGFPSKVEYLESGRTCEGVCDTHLTILLLRKEIEVALESLKGAKFQIVNLLKEHEEVQKSMKQSQESMQCFSSQVLALQAEVRNSEEEYDLKIGELDHKVQKIEVMAQEAKTFWYQKKEVLEIEVSDAKVFAAQKSSEASILLAKFEEAQETMNEADVVVNALVKAKETAEMEAERLKTVEARLTNERDLLLDDVQNLQALNRQKDQQYKNLEMELCSGLSELNVLVLSMEDALAQVRDTSNDELKLMFCDLHLLKSQIQQSTSSTRSWLEDIWSEIIAKDCAVSVLHLCHMGVLLEAATGLNAENGLLNHGLSASNSIIAELKEHNSKAKRELQICKTLKGKLLVDIKNSFDRILRKEDETGKISAKLNSFEKKILDLQVQEELMLARSNSMGFELSLLIKELDISHKDAFAALSDQEKLLKDKQELIESQVEFMTKDLIAKDFESLILTSELKQMVLQKADLEGQQETFIAFLANIQKELVFCTVEAEMEQLLTSDADAEVAHLKKLVEENDVERSYLSEKLKQCTSRLAEVNQVNKGLKCDMQSLKEVACSNNKLKGELLDIIETKERLMAEVQVYKTEMEHLTREWGIKESELGASICRLREEMERKDTEISKMHSMKEENNTLQNELRNLMADYSRVFDDLQAKNSDSEHSLNCMNAFGQENHRLQEKVCSLETCIASLRADCDIKSKEVEELQHSQSVVAREIISKTQDLDIQTKTINALKEENCSLRTNYMSLNQNKDAILSALSLNFKKCFDLVQAMNATGDNMFQISDEKNDTLLNKIVHEISENDETATKLIAECESLEMFTEQIISENMSVKAELLRKDEIMNGLLFDLRLLQESASNAKDQKDELERTVAAMESLEDELALRLDELDKASAHSQMLETQIKEKTGLISALELDISEMRESQQQALEKNAKLRAEMEDLLVAKSSLEEELMDRTKVMERLEEEIFQMDNALGQMNTALEGLRNDLIIVTSERDHLDSEITVLRDKLEDTQALAEEHEAIANEAQQIAESRKAYAEEKEEEVKLLEKSVEELEYTVNVLENKVDFVKGEAERQRLQREDLGLELQDIKDQMLSVHTSAATMDLGTKNAQSAESRDLDLQRYVEGREKELQEACKQVKMLEKNIADKEAEISRCKVHISELNLHAEAQAREYKQKFKALEAMAEQVKPDHLSSNVTNLSSSKQEKNAVKSRGSGSPFKCIGLGLVQQINSEKDEELTAGKLRIEELEALAVNRQKEIFMLNARLAAAESMTHDVIRDLLGVKLDMTNYASLLDHQQIQKLTEDARVNSKESLVEEQEVGKLKQQLNEFIEERKGWLEEINRRHAEMVAARIASEKLRQRDQYLSAENEMLKKENMSHEKKLMELEGEVNKLSGQQNIQQRIHHHAKIKEENNRLKTQNEDLSAKLQRSEIILSRVKEELAHYRASSGGRAPSIDFDEEHRLTKRLRDTEEERLQLAEKLLSLCTSILKAAGITRPLSEINPFVAEEALEQLKARIVTLEGELQDLSFKNKITNERIRLSELKQQTSPLSSKTTQEDCTAPFLRTLSR